VKRFDEIKRREQLADVLALHAGAASVDEPDLTEAAGVRFEEVLVGDVADLVRAEWVEVERVGDRDFDRVVNVIGHEAFYVCDTLNPENPMVLFNHATREMTAKIVYYGPGLCGKTTNLMVIFDKLDASQKGKMLSLATKTDRTLFFDLLPVDIGRVGAFNLKIQLYTVPGQVFYNETRKLVLKGADAVVFVADSQLSMIDSTRDSFANLLENLEQNNIDPNDTPIIVQFNKRDIPGVLPVEQLQEALGLEGYPYTEAAAIKGDGVMETFHLVSKITAKHLSARLQGKPIAVEKTKPAAKAEPESEQAAPNPFTESVPFPESQVDSSYDRMEEVSLEQLLSEGRERPATISGNVALPVDFEDVEELDAAAIMTNDDAGVTLIDEPVQDDRIAILEQKVTALQSELDSIRDEYRVEIEEVLRDLGDLTSRLRRRLDS
jgi:signal recognition particle receptor subunit beta